MTPRSSRTLLATAIAVVCAGAWPSAQVFDPALRFRALPTAHFVIYFHQGEDRLARRLAAIAEETWRALEGSLGRTPPPRTRVVLADQTELFNGYATPVPYDTVVLYPVTPSGSDSDFEDWLRLLFTHEFTHIVHLDRSEGWARVVRGIFGRTPYAFPNLFLPPWQVEGLATYEESAITGNGRLHAGDFQAIVGEAARQGRLEPLDRINGGLTDWPGSTGVYAYGVGFHQYLADRFGADTLAALAGATARRVPYVASPAFMRVYGESLGDLWRDYQASLVAAVEPAPPPDPGLRRLTHAGFGVKGPRFDRVACPGCDAGIVYSAVNPRGFPALYRVGLDGGEPRRLATRYLGSTTAIARDRIYFNQVELRRNAGRYSDLYVLSRADGRVRRLTADARLQDPDLSPDGKTLVATQNRPGQRDLVVLSVVPGFPPSLATGAGELRRGSAQREHEGGRPAAATLIAEAGTQFDAPRWSPDGRTIAVERHRTGAMPDIVLVDVATKSVRVLAAAARTRFVTPAWRPDGAAIVAAAAPDEQTFNLVEVPVDGSPPRRITHTTGGALWPDVSPDGKTIVFAGYSTDGADVFAMPYPVGAAAMERDRRAGAALAPPRGPTIATPADRADQAGPLPGEGYSPLETLRPTSWTPVVESDSDQIRAGAGISGVDVLGYHGYTASATWLVSGPADAQTPGAETPDWQISYVYNRWRPAFYASASDRTTFFAGPVSDAGAPTPATRRAREIEGGVLVSFRHARAQHAARLSVVRAVADYLLGDLSFSRDRTPIRASWQTVTAHAYGYSISRERGLAAGATAEVVRRGLGSSASATTTTADVRAYLPGLADHHVLALRLGGGRSTGDATVGRTFLLGGASPGDGVTDLGSAAFTLLRGFRPGTFAGSRVALANAEYRWPIARPQRGHSTWPLFLHSVHAAVFADAGHAWTDRFEARAIKSSAGAQLSADLVAGFFAPFTISAGAAWGHDGGGRVADGVIAYFRVGKAF